LQYYNKFGVIERRDILGDRVSLSSTLVAGVGVLILFVNVGDGGVSDAAVCAFHNLPPWTQRGVGGPAKRGERRRYLARAGNCGDFVPRDFAPLKPQHLRYHRPRAKGVSEAKRMYSEAGELLKRVLL
jgi:hypothetical protein